MKKIIVVIVLINILMPSLAYCKAKTHAGAGALIGGFSGFVLGIGTSLATCKGADEEDGFCAVPLVSVGTAIVGSVIGLAIGSGIKRKQPVVQVTVDPKTKTYGAAMNMTF